MKNRNTKSKRQIHVLVTDPLSPHAIEYLNTHTKVDILLNLKRNELKNIIGRYSALICRSRTKIDLEILKAGQRGKLKVIATATAGRNHIDVSQAKKFGITVLFSPWGNALANAEYIIGSMIALSRHIATADRMIRKGIWNQEILVGPEIAGKIFGTIGFGKIGSLVAEKARLMGMKVLAYDPYCLPDEFTCKQVKQVSLKKLLKISDFISLSVPFLKSTNNLITKKELELIKSTSFIIQSSRGGIINENDLLDSLIKKQIAGAAIDVFENEPKIKSCFKNLDNVILTPHIACSSIESRTRSGVAVSKDVVNFLKGKKVTCIANDDQFFIQDKL